MSSGSADSWTIGAYGGGNRLWRGDLALRGGAAHHWHDIDIDRAVAFVGFSDSLSASYDARTAQAFGEVAYGATLDQFRFEPFGNLPMSTSRRTASPRAAARRL